ncbi:hypothetical protein [Novosphingobium sediminicola]|uniref:Uncharacterized protein n=1 Tax=Novosphingobium sediminicola TaxID=563162 RepID=A0A7W6CS73_9SPHN|nr:hypothetical protein [Novosphingobium sediminicola]MBB3956812.1 hypothetical protein [Novosphingobium sediminicola]
MIDVSRARSRPAILRMYDQAVDLLSLAGLIGMIGTTIYCIGIRVHYERSYAAALLIALIGLLVMLIAWAQQVIAARDLATWREMVEWQIRAARRRAEQEADGVEEHDRYFECLVGALISDMQSAAKDIPNP